MALNYFEMNENENQILQFLARKRWYRQAMITELAREFRKSWNTISTAAKSLEKKGSCWFKKSNSMKHDGALRAPSAHIMTIQNNKDKFLRIVYNENYGEI